MSFLKIIGFSIISISTFLVGMEIIAGKYLRNNVIYLQSYLTLNAKPLIEFAPETKATPPYHFRRNASSAKNVAWFVVDKNETVGKLFLTPEEGMIRNAMGDHVINKWGYRGPYFEKSLQKMFIE